MIEFPYVPHWWKFSNKFGMLKEGYSKPDHILGFDTETCNGEIITQQFSSSIEDRILECNVSNSIETFFGYLGKFCGNIIMYGFVVPFDLPQVFRKYIENFADDDFEIQLCGWHCKIFCSRNWYAIFSKGTTRILYLDISSYFSGTLKRVSASFGLKIGKLDRPQGLGYKKFTARDKEFREYALMDSRLCYQMGLLMDKMHEDFDIPQTFSSANFAEKVFRRKFFNIGDRLQFTPYSVTRLSELCYHGGKNGYYLDKPAMVQGCYEYDFNSAYPCAMFELPSFIAGDYEKTRSLSDKYVGVYKYQGTISECPYGSLFDLEFHYFKNVARPVQGFATGFEIQEAINSGELKLDRISGYIWKPAGYADSPLKRYVQFFWEQKNKLEKGTVQYLFAKLCLNSLYGKFVQRNPWKKPKATLTEDFSLDVEQSKEIAGGLYHPFVGSNITGHTRARLHKEEHRLNALECSTDSIKTKTYKASYEKNHSLGAMQMESKFCDKCDKKVKKFNAIFARNRLNVLMCDKGHVLKAALHGFWREPEELKAMAEQKRNWYEVSRMPMVREAMLHSGKPMFQTYSEDRILNVDWNEMITL